MGPGGVLPRESREEWQGGRKGRFPKPGKEKSDNLDKGDGTSRFVWGKEGREGQRERTFWV